MKIEMDIYTASAIKTVGIIIAVIIGLYITKNSWCLLGLLLLTSYSKKDD